MTKSPTVIPSTPQPPPGEALPADLVKAMALDIGKEVAAYVERQYPKAVEATSSTFLLSLRNSIYNEIIAAIGSSDPAEIERRLKERKQARRRLRTLWKAARTVQPGEPEKADDILAGRVPLEPDL